MDELLHEIPHGISKSFQHTDLVVIMVNLKQFGTHYLSTYHKIEKVGL